MASQLYPSAKESLLKGEINLTSNDVRVQLVDTADETFASGDQFLSQITAAGRVGPAVTLTSKSVTGGVFDAADTTIPAVSGDSIEALVLYVHTGTEATSRLIAWIDGISFQPNGGDCTIIWSNGSSKIFAL